MLGTKQQRILGSENPQPEQINSGQVDIEGIISALPPGERWVKHLEEDLLPFWTMEEALGKDGDFPTYRCNDGNLYTPQNPCIELTNAVTGIVWLDREYVRSRSRQAYAYGIAYHLTGDETYLGYAKAGVDFLREHALDPAGGVYTYWQDGEGAPAIKQRTSQDLAYALSSMGFYYYLTRDEEVLTSVLTLKEYIFNTYYDEELDLMTWVKEESPSGDKPNQKELVAQLDQIYAYMLWLTPALPQEHQEKWEQDLEHLAYIIITQFYTPKQNLFWGATTASNLKHLGADHTDFGHSVKTMWLIYQIGKRTNNLDLIVFAEEKAGQILEEAYVKETGSWARRLDENGELDTDKEWWILAELDQTAATLALVDPAYAVYLPKTYDYWFEYMVDHEHKGIWHMVNPETNKPYDCIETPDKCFPKQHSWKNAFHSFEHALIGYITSQQLHSQPVTLYYAFEIPDDGGNVHPYFYFGKIREIDANKVTFTDIR